MVWQDKRAGDFDIYAQSMANPPWELSAIQPSAAICGEASYATITGTRFISHPPTQVELTKSGFSSLAGSNIAVHDDVTLYCDFDLAEALSGKWNVSISDAE